MQKTSKTSQQRQGPRFDPACEQVGSIVLKRQRVSGYRFTHVPCISACFACYSGPRRRVLRTRRARNSRARSAMTSSTGRRRKDVVPARSRAPANSSRSGKVTWQLIAHSSQKQRAPSLSDPSVWAMPLETCFCAGIRSQMGSRHLHPEPMTWRRDVALSLISRNASRPKAVLGRAVRPEPRSALASCSEL